MNFFTYRISLDIRETTSQAFINVKKNDTARKFIFTLTDNGRAYQITEGCTAVFRAKKPDGTILYNNCPIVGNAMEYYLTSQTVAAVGIVECEITLYGSNSKQITSPRFSLAVDDVLYSDSEVESKDEFTALTGAIDEVRASKAFTIKLTTTSGGITADKTFTEIAEKVNAAKSVIVNMDGWAFPVSYSADSGKIVFSSLWANIAEIPNTVTFAVNSSDVWNVVVSDIPTTAQVSAKYTKPVNGIPKDDLASDVQASLDKADTALQEHQSLAAYRTSADQDVIDGSKQDKLIAGENITIAADGRTISATGGGGGASVELDTTLTQSGKAADAKATGDRLDSLSEEIANLQISGGGMSQTLRTAIYNLLMDAAYQSTGHESDKTALEELLTGSSGGEEVIYYTIEKTLTNVTISNGAVSVAAGAAYSATLTADEGYTLNEVTVTMGGETVTVTNGVISIASVTGNIVITATATSEESGNDPFAGTWVEGFRLQLNGTEYPTGHTDYDTTDYVDCSGFSVVTLRTEFNINLKINAVVWYDESKKWISGEGEIYINANSTTYSPSASFTKPNGALYCRICGPSITITNTTYRYYELVTITVS